MHTIFLTDEKYNMILSKGQVVKHGTSLDRLEGVLKEGLCPASGRNTVRVKDEIAPVVPGVYVANNLSYYGASAAFTSYMYEMNRNGTRSGDVPIVLHIRLGEDCSLLADEDYVQNQNTQTEDERLTELEKEANRVWSEHETGAIANRVIPIEWIKAIEYPILRDVSSISCNKKYSECLDQDIWLLVLAYWQNKTKSKVLEFDVMLDNFVRTNRYRPHFTNVVEFSDESIHGLRSLNVVRDENKLYEYAREFWREFTFRLDHFGLEYNS